MPRAVVLLAACVLALGACTSDRGERAAERAADSAAERPAARPEARAPAPPAAPQPLPADSGAARGGDSITAVPATGATDTVQMLGDTLGYRFAPDMLGIRPGDAVAFVLISGGPHNVAFWRDSIPAGAAEQLQANMPETIRPLAGPYLMAAGERYTISFGSAPAGAYRYYCVPHLSNGMVGTIIVR